MLEVEMVEKLIRGGIAPRRADRLVSEFKAHYDDLRDEHLLRGESPAQAAERATAQLGYSTEFIERILLEARLKSFAWRRPWIAYVLLPVMGFAGLFVGSICALLAAAWVLESFYGPLTQDPLLVKWLAPSGSLYLCWISPMLGTCLLAWKAFSRRAFSYWPSIGIALVALLGSHTNFRLG